MGNTAVKETVTVGIFRTHAEAEAAIEQLRLGGFDLKRLSIAGKDYETREDVVGYYTTGDRMKRWGAAGAFWGGIWGLLFGAAFFLVPGVGPVLAQRILDWRTERGRFATVDQLSDVPGIGDARLAQLRDLVQV